MGSLDRRSFVGTMALAGLAAEAQADDVAGGSSGDPTDVTRKLAHYLVSSKPQDVPEPVRKQAARTFLNWAGCAIGGSRHETLDFAIGALQPFFGQAQAGVLGRGERMDV